MKKLLIALSIMMCMVTTVSSQTISTDSVIPITATQLKTANLIFAEHDKLKQELPLLESKITNLETINSNWERVDSLRSKQLSEAKFIISNKDQDISRLKKKNKLKNFFLSATSITSVILALLCVVR